MFDYKPEETLEAIARGFFQKIGLEGQVKPDLMTVIVKLKHAVPSFNYRRTPDKDMPRAEAQWHSDKFVLDMRETTFVGMRRGDPRSSFTIWHELSHYILGHVGVLDRSTQQLKPGISGSLLRHQETEANRLASILMAPEPQVPEGSTVEEISERFGMSYEAAAIRKENVETLRRRRRGERRPVPVSIVEYLKDAKAKGANIRTPLDD